MKKLVLIIFSFGCGFTVRGEIAEEDKNKTMTCTDTRDGESFTFNGNDVLDVRYGINGPSSFVLVDSDGVKRTITDKQEPFYKCVEADLK